MEIQKTQDYSAFSLRRNNRDVTQSALNRLKNKMKKVNLLHLFPLIVDEDMNILDGQKRFLASKELTEEGHPVTIHYIIAEDGTDMKVIAEAMAAVEKWQLKDYLKHYLAEGKSDYVVLNGFIQDHPWMTLTSAVMLSCGRQGKYSKEGRELFQSGEFKITSPERLIEVINIVEAAMSYGVKGANKTMFIAALAILLDLEGVSPEKMQKKLTTYPDLVTNRATLGGYVNMLVRIYNVMERADRRIPVPGQYFMEM